MLRRTRGNRYGLPVPMRLTTSAVVVEGLMTIWSEDESVPRA
jgi:hypothetical protein